MKGLDKNGYVEDVKLAKRIITETFSRWPFCYWKHSCIGEERTIKEWLEKVNSSLEEFNGGFSILRNNEHYDLGGTDGWGGLFICELSHWCKEINDYDISDISDPMCTIYDEDNKEFVTFILHEID